MESGQMDAHLGFPEALSKKAFLQPLNVRTIKPELFSLEKISNRTPMKNHQQFPDQNPCQRIPVLVGSQESGQIMVQLEIQGP
jgi:hypothetical protein